MPILFALHPEQRVTAERSQTSAVGLNDASQLRPRDNAERRYRSRQKRSGAMSAGLLEGYA